MKSIQTFFPVLLLSFLLFVSCEDPLIEQLPPPDSSADSSVSKGGELSDARIGAARQYPLGVYVTLYDKSNSKYTEPRFIRHSKASVVMLLNGENRNAAQVTAYLDEVRKETTHPKFVVEFPRDLALNYMENKFNAQRDELITFVKDVSKHPSVGGFYLIDEPVFRSQNNSKVNPFNVRSLHNIVKENSNKLSFITFSYINACNEKGGESDCSPVEDYSNAMDVALFDIYPFEPGYDEFEGGTDKGARGYLKAFEKAQDVVVKMNRTRNTPLEWGMVFQASGSKNFGKRLPTLDELRLMLYAPLAIRNYALPTYMIGYSLTIALSAEQGNGPYPCADGKDWFFGTGNCQAWNNILQEYNRWKWAVGPESLQRWETQQWTGSSFNSTNNLKANRFMSRSGATYLVAVNVTNKWQSVRYRKASYNEALSVARPLEGRGFLSKIDVESYQSNNQRYVVSFKDRLPPYGTRVYKLE